VRDPHQVVQFAAQFADRLRQKLLATLGFTDQHKQRFDTFVNLPQLVGERLNPIGPQIEFLDQTHGSIAAADQRFPSRAPLFPRIRLADRYIEIFAIA
jgi:hypothetical protein